MEQVLVVTHAAVQGLLHGTGFVKADTTKLELLLQGACYIERSLAEGNPHFRQIIPYVAVLRNDRVFTMQRLRAQTESRLHHKLSLGVGGHINPCDGTINAAVLLKAAAREIDEEVVVGTFDTGELNFVGFINDSSTAVSRDHLGCFYVLRVEGEVTVRETDKMTGTFLSPREIKARFPDLETWSQLIFPELGIRQV